MKAEQDGWWYARLYPGGLEHMDDAVRELVPPLAALAAEHGAQRWFFIRYSDLSGPHVRFRLRGRRDLLDRVHRELPRLTRECGALAQAKRAPAETIFPVSLQFFGGRHAGADVAVYEPEDGKYGGPAGVILAEELFQVSSDLTLWAASAPKAPDRAALAVLLMRESLLAANSVSDAIVPSADEFWRRHLHWWTRDAGSGAEQLRARLQDEAGRDRHGIAARVQEMMADPVVARWRLRWSAAVVQYLRQASAARLPRTPGHLIFHQNHMTLNRLGILPREEALLSIIASPSSRPAPRPEVASQPVPAGQS